MAKKKQSPFPSPDSLRTAGFIVLLMLGLVAAVMAAAAFLRGVSASAIFTVRDVVIADNIQPLELPELAKLKGQNLFAVDLAKVEARVRARYPQLADLRVTRGFPDRILVSALKRTPFAKVSLEGRVCVVDAHGYMIGLPIEGQEALTVIKGIRPQRFAPGVALHDEKFRLAAGIISHFKRDPNLASVVLAAVRLEDLTRIGCDLRVGTSEFQIIIDQENMDARIKIFSELLFRGGLDLASVKYMDLRFKEPVIGQKKAKK